MEVVKLTEEQFDEQFTLVDNHIDTNASFTGQMFETYGEELEYVKEMAKEKRVITIIESDNDNDGLDLFYASGMHLVNRLGYLITTEPITFEFEVNLED
jgi:hypothetical protein